MFYRVLAFLLLSTWIRHCTCSRVYGVRTVIMVVVQADMDELDSDLRAEVDTEEKEVNDKLAQAMDQVRFTLH